ncbi:hypothetical protein DUNSADRAFT_11466 [Dunaliella salina]|uniref:Uncharacterized protein n=1 Tax=Dunaliella salina TaxID=3046 RepID=A0ABQ7GDA4_DUNSA|nr:hypothetical protein DUNSADRAFT_11466 [Dunaliella salina]|eukprot:KAF5832594.1 hypothetical protein DUNSADRAFT_11466 [Dunaliella salina]
MQPSDPFSESVDACLSFGPSSHANICIKDTLDVSGNFLNQILLRMAIQAGHRVLLVPMEQSFEKYKFALKKMGVNLQQCVDDGHVAVVSPAPVLARQQQCQQQQQQPPQGEQEEQEPQGPTKSPLRRLHATMARALDQLVAWVPPSSQGSEAAAHHSQHAWSGEHGHHPQGGPISAGCSLTVIIDGLSELSILATSSREWLSFLHYCLHLGASHQTHTAVNRVLRCHVDDSLLEEDGGWIKLLEHASQDEEQCVGKRGNGCI